MPGMELTLLPLAASAWENQYYWYKNGSHSNDSSVPGWAEHYTCHRGFLCRCNTGEWTSVLKCSVSLNQLCRSPEVYYFRNFEFHYIICMRILYLRAPELYLINGIKKALEFMFLFTYIVTTCHHANFRLEYCMLIILPEFYVF